MTNLTDLIGRLEQAEEGSRELDADICKALPGPMKLVQGPNGSRWPDYTTSIDAAITLVPEGWQWNVTNTGFRLGFVLLAYKKIRIREDGATPALAICAAALKARDAAQDS